MDKKTELKIIKLYQSGATYRDIMQSVKTYPSAIKKCLEDNGIRPRHVLTNTDEKRIVELYMASKSVKYAAEKSGFSASSVTKVLAHHDICTTKRIPDKKIEEGIKVYLSTRSIKQAAEAIGCSKTTMLSYLKKNNVGLENRFKSIEKAIVQDYLSGKSSVEVSKKYDISTTTVLKMVRTQGYSVRSNKENSRRYYYDVEYFQKIDEPDKAYWLGFMYADGYVSSANKQKKIGIALAQKDKNHLIKFTQALKSNYPIRTYVPTKGGYSTKPYCRVQVFGEDIYEELVSHGVAEHKTLIVKPPKIDSNLVSHFIRGYFDGDGCITASFQKKRNQYKIKIVGTKELLKFIGKAIEENNIANISQYYKRRDTDKVYNLDFGGNNQVLAFCKYIYQDATTYLDRKYNKYIELKTLYENSRVIPKGIA